MVNRPLIYDEEQVDPFDILWAFKDILTALGQIETDVTGQTTTVVAGLDAGNTTPASLLVNLSAGRIYQQGPIDPTAYGPLPVDETVVQNQGAAPAQQIQLTTAGLSVGQSQFALIEAVFAPLDIVRPGDPTGGVLNYWNSNNPTEPFQGPNGTGQSQPTERQATIEISVVYGAPATTGSETPPSPSSGAVPLYLIDLAFGQTAINQNQIFVAGPNATGNVPNNYPQAPFLAGLLNSHHNGLPGQAPKIILTNGLEVQGILPLANLPGGQTRTSGITSGAVPLNNTDSFVGLRLTGPATATLPAAPVNGQITLADLGKNFSVNNVVVTAPVIGGVQSTFPGGTSGSGAVTTATLDVDGQVPTFTLFPDSNSWSFKS